MPSEMRYHCSGCGFEQDDAREWLALRVSQDRRGLEIRRFEDSGPDDVLFCSEGCAFGRISEVFGGRVGGESDAR